MHIHHLALRTSEVERLARFYRDVVGLPDAVGHEERLAKGARSRWLAAGSALLMIEERGPEEPPIAEGSMELVAFTLEPSDLTGAVARLAGAGVTVEQRTAFTLYFRDPDGRRVGLSHYPQSPEHPGEAARSPTPPPR